MWNRRRVIAELGESEKAFLWSQDHGLLPKTKMCIIHETPMKFYRTTHVHGLGMFRCYKNRHNKSVSIAKGK